MGYRSEVVIVTAPEVEWPVEVQAELTQYAPITVETTRKCWYCSDIKWYEEYFSKTLAWLDELEFEEFGFMRIGEDLEDIESRGTPFEFGVYVSRELYI